MKYTRQRRRAIHRRAQKLLAKKGPTMHLPMPLVEAQALSFAREWIARFSQGSSPWSPAPSMSAEAGRAVYQAVEAMAEDLLRQAILAGPAHRMLVIEAAKSGDRDAAALLQSVLLEMKSRDATADMPVELKEYDMWLTRTGGNQQKRRIPKKADNLLRDLCIAMTVAALIDRFGLDPTGRSARKRSACALVAEALATAQIRRSHKAVEAIWARYQGWMPTVPGWASA